MALLFGFGKFPKSWEFNLFGYAFLFLNRPPNRRTWMTFPLLVDRIFYRVIFNWHIPNFDFHHRLEDYEGLQSVSFETEQRIDNF